MLFLIFCLFAVNAFGNTQWASRLIAFSSEYTDKGHPHRYRAQQILGKPNKLPAIGSSPCAWSPAKQNRGTEWIEVEFERAQFVQQVVIGESFNSGCIVKVEAIGSEGETIIVYEAGKHGASRTADGLFHVYMQKTAFKIKRVRVTLDTRQVIGWNHLDAIAISDSTIPIKVLIRLVGDIKPEAIEPLPASVNSPYDEILPVISPDGKTLYFDRKNHPKNIKSEYANDDIWVSSFIEGSWSEPTHLKGPLNNENHNYVCSVMPGSNALLLGNIYEKDGRASGGVSISYKENGNWTFPEALQITGYQNINEYSEFALSSNRKVLVMAIETNSSYGDRDIYVSFANENGEWSEPLNLGPQINTAATELTPFLAADNKTLFFSSAGFSGFGNTDMFVSKRLDDSWTKWTEPLNMGPLLNSEDWDISYTVDALGEYAYFVSYANTNNNSADIFRVKLPQDAKPEPIALLEGNVYDAETKQPIMAEILYKQIDMPKETGIVRSNPEDGAFTVALSPEKKYLIWAKAKNYYALADTVMISINKNPRKKIFLKPLKIGETIALNRINFVKGEAFFLEESYPELDRLTQMMLESETLHILLEGHTDISGNARANQALSESRVLAVKGYLTERGVEANRIELKAYGETKPLTYQRDEASKRKNRRVVFKVLGL